MRNRLQLVDAALAEGGAGALERLCKTDKAAAVLMARRRANQSDSEAVRSLLSIQAPLTFLPSAVFAWSCRALASLFLAHCLRSVDDAMEGKDLKVRGLRLRKGLAASAF